MKSFKNQLNHTKSNGLLGCCGYLPLSLEYHLPTLPRPSHRFHDVVEDAIRASTGAGGLVNLLEKIEKKTH